MGCCPLALALGLPRHKGEMVQHWLPALSRSRICSWVRLLFLHFLESFIIDPCHRRKQSAVEVWDTCSLDLTNIEGCGVLNANRHFEFIDQPAFMIHDEEMKSNQSS